MNHDYALCAQEPCQRCDDYGAGYSAGKDKAYFEIQHHAGANHAPTCGCQPCLTVRLITAGGEGAEYAEANT